MTRLRFRGSASMTLVVALALIHNARAQNPAPVAPRPLPARAPDCTVRSYKIYSLGDFENDPGLCEWIAQAIPDAIAVGTWGSQGVIRYYAPRNILMVCHTSEVQTQVDGFLKDVKKSLSTTTKAKVAAPRNLDMPREVVQAGYKEGQPRVASPAPEPTLSYPVPTQPKAPKHLFHFIIRYEGEGIIDDNVVKAMKDYYRAEKQASEPRRQGYYPAAPPVDPLSGSPAPSVPLKEKEEEKPVPLKEKEKKKDDKGTEKERQLSSR